MADYAELHCHSYFSFHDGASSIEDILLQARDLGYRALALTDHDNLCGAMRFAQAAPSWGMRAIIGAEATTQGDHHLTLLAATAQGYHNLCRLLSTAHIDSPRGKPQLDPSRLAEHDGGLIVLSGCAQGEIPSLLMSDRWEEARGVARRYKEWLGDGFYLELQNNLCYGDRERNRRLVALSGELQIPVVATNNVHYHVRERHQLQDALVAIRHCKTLEETHRERRPNSEFYLKSPAEMAALFAELREAVANSVRIAERCTFDLRHDLEYQFPDSLVPNGYTADTYLKVLCYEAARRRYGTISPRCRARLEEELRLIRKHQLSGFFLIYHQILQVAREVAIELGVGDPQRPLEEDPPGRSRGSSVALLVGYLIGLSHIDPLQYDLTLERFLHEDLTSVPDVDLDFPRNIREGLIKRVHAKWGWQHAALCGMFDTYQLKGAVRDLGKVLGLPDQELDQLAKGVEGHSAATLQEEMGRMPGYADKASAPVWRDLVRLSSEIDGFPKGLAQHPGGMIISSRPLIELVPVQRGAIDGRYVCQWDKDDIDDAGFVKIDFLSLGALSQMQEAQRLAEDRHGQRIDLSRVDHEDPQVYEMLGKGDTIGVFQVESAAQIQNIVRMKPRSLVDMAIEVALVRPGVGATDSTHMYIARRMGKEPVIYDHPLTQRALERTLGAVVFQDQLVQLAVDVAGFGSAEGDQMRRAFGRRNNQRLIEAYWEKFRDGAAARGVAEDVARKIFARFNGEYMFPESHAYAFGVTAYQAAFLKRYYPLEFYTGLFNEQPMGFYSLESLKEDARRHGVRVLNPNINLSREKCAIHRECLLLGLLQVAGVGEMAARRLVEEREAGGLYRSLADLMERTSLRREVYDSLADAGALDGFGMNRRTIRWQIGLQYRPARDERQDGDWQMACSLPVEQDVVDLPAQSTWERMQGEYRSLGLYPDGHIMAHLRPQLAKGLSSSLDIGKMKDGRLVKVAGLVIRSQRPYTKTGVVFLTLEDELGHVPLIVWAPVYERYRIQLRAPLLIVSGTVSHRDGTVNVVVGHVEPLSGQDRPL